MKMNWERKKKLLWRWSIFSGGLIAIFWTIWYMVAGHVPEVTVIKITNSWTWELPFTISRWWDILIGPIWSNILIFLITSEQKRDEYLNFYLGIGLGVGVGLVVGVGVGVGVGLVAGLGVGVGAGLVAGLGVGLVAGLVAILGVGLDVDVGLDAGLVAGLGAILGVGLGVGVGAGLVAGLGVVLVAGLVVGVKLIFNAITWSWVKKWFLAN